MLLRSLGKSCPGFGDEPVFCGLWENYPDFIHRFASQFSDVIFRMQAAVLKDDF
jgi:hypothetical protein